MLSFCEGALDSKTFLVELICLNSASACSAPIWKMMYFDALRLQV